MKNNEFWFKNITLVTLMASLLAINGCTKEFEKYNTDTVGVTDAELIPDYNNIGGFFPDMQYSLLPNNPSGSLWLEATLGEYLISCGFAGYTMESYDEESPANTYNFTGWSTFELFGVGYNYFMGPVNQLRKMGTPASAPDFWAIGLILQVAEMHKITDIYGPVPFSKYGAGGTQVPYDTQESIYPELFAELDTAVINLKAYIAAYPGAKPFKKFDVVYAGDYTKWLKYANSLRLRLAMHIVKIDPATAQQQALKAVDPANGGVLTSNADNAITKSAYHQLGVVTNEWNVGRSAGVIVSYMDSYNDPRISKYFEPSEFEGEYQGRYIGLRTGAIKGSLTACNLFSRISRSTYTRAAPGVIMTVSEVKFLLAEGALRGWNMGGTPQEFYEEGISSSFDKWQVGGASIYINDAISTPQDYVDPNEPLNNTPALSSITIKWDEAATNEEKLERIITQKWIALFPDGTEAWANFRRTGYPKLWPIIESRNHSQGTISTEILVRRQPYPLLEYTNNAAEVEKAIILLGGPDTGGTRVWWDVDGPNF